MKRFLARATILTVLLGSIPLRLEASDHCMWWWYYTLIEIDTVTGGYVETRYYKWVCYPDEPY